MICLQYNRHKNQSKTTSFNTRFLRSEVLSSGFFFSVFQVQHSGIRMQMTWVWCRTSSWLVRSQRCSCTSTTVWTSSCIVQQVLKSMYQSITILNNHKRTMNRNIRFFLGFTETVAILLFSLICVNIVKISNALLMSIFLPPAQRYNNFDLKLEQS